MPAFQRWNASAEAMTNPCRSKWLCLTFLSLLAAPWGLAIGQADAPASDRAGPTARDGQHDFDFEFGSWSVRLSRLQEPLTGRTAWTDYAGTSVVRPLWNGRGNLGELDVRGSSGNILGLSLRLYDAQTQQWNISWANSNNGELGPPMVGGFDESGRGEFYNQERYNGRAIFVRFIFSDVTDSSFRLEQAFSADGGKSWEANWIAEFSRQAAGDDAAVEGSSR